jgi:adenylate cyclase
MFALVGSHLGDQAIAAKPLPLPDKPSIAVLPFTNMSGDPEQEYFADGMVEDIITALSRVKWFFVIARNSSFTYKGKAVDIRQVGRELGVRYVLEGSIRKAGNRIRITGQLIEAVTGRHVWADRFDGDLADLFELQDRITESVVGAVEPSLRLAEIERARAKPTESLDAYDYYLRALPFHYAMRREKSDLALQLFAKAYELDPQFALAKATACGTYLFRKAQVWNQPGELEEGYRLALDAAALAPDDPQVLRLAGQAAVYLGRDYDYGLSLVQRAVTINPNSAQVLNSAAWTYNYYCDPSPAVEYFNRAMRLSPLDVEKPLMLSGLSFSYFLLRDYEAMLGHAVQAAKEMPTFVSAHRFATAALSCLGRMEEARHWAAQHMALAPNYRLEVARPILGWRDPAVVDHYFAALRAAGIPE